MSRPIENQGGRERLLAAADWMLDRLVVSRCAPFNRVRFCFRCRLMLFSFLLIGLSLGASLVVSTRLIVTNSDEWLARVAHSLGALSGDELEQKIAPAMEGTAAKGLLDRLNRVAEVHRHRVRDFRVEVFRRESRAASAAEPQLLSLGRSGSPGSASPKEVSDRALAPHLFEALEGSPPRALRIARRGQDRIAAAAPIRNAVGEVVGVLEVSRSSGLFQPETLRLVIGLFLAALVTAIVGVGVAFLFARSASRPLRDLALATDAVAAGNLGQRIDCSRGDEIGELAGAFNRMTRSLQQARSSNDADEARIRRVSEVLERSQNFLNNLIESLPQFIDQKDRDGRYTFVTEYVCHRMGRIREEVLGSTDFDLHPPAVAEARRQRELKVIARGESVEGLEEGRGDDGASTWMKVVTMPLRNESQEILGTQSVYFDVTELKRAEQELLTTHEQLVKASRVAGMAEVATGILHNVGNVLNSVNVSATLVRDRLRASRVGNLGKAVALIEEHRDDLAAFLTGDPKGRQLTGYLASLAGHLEQERSSVLNEMKGLTDSVDHIKQIVATQQAHAKAGGVTEKLVPSALLEDALRLHASKLGKEGVEIVRLYQEVPEVMVDRHRTLQILVNLVTNALNAIQESGRPGGRLIIGLAWNGADRVRMLVRDNGKGIARENLSRVFQHGFTTRKDGHGFGLHSGALAAKEMGGALTVQSDGPGKGAVFILELPVTVPLERAA